MCHQWNVDRAMCLYFWPVFFKKQIGVLCSLLSQDSVALKDGSAEHQKSLVLNYPEPEIPRGAAE